MSLKRNGAVTLVVVLGAAIGSAPAEAAATRAEYIAQVDPICQNATPPLVKANKAYAKNFNRLIARLRARRFKGIIKVIHRTATALNRFTNIYGSVTDQVAAVPPAPPDAPIIEGWLQHRRDAEGFARSAARAMSQIKFRRFDQQIAKAAQADTQASGSISGFGFQYCA